MDYPKRYKLAHLPTPIQRLERLGRRWGVGLSVKRDDETGLLTTGNKIRKLEFLVADAMEKGCDTLLTCGGIQSNHARATAAVAARLGLKAALILRGEEPSLPEGNLLLDRLFGAEVTFVSDGEYKKIADVFDRKSRELQRKGRRPYIIPEGGSNGLGAFGYTLMMAELKNQMAEGGLSSALGGSGGFSSIVCAVGTGGTYAGLLIGSKVLKMPIRIYGINVCDSAGYFRTRIMGIINEARELYNLEIEVAEEEIQIIDGYVGEGYGRTPKEVWELLREVAREEGLLLDPVYTGKAMWGLRDQIARDKKRFGKEILFLHTGGLFGLFPHAAELSRIQ